MKKLLTLAFITATVSADAVIVRITTGLDKAVVDSNGLIADSTGFVGVGFFPTLADAVFSTTAAADLEANFSIFGAGGMVGFGGIGGSYEFNDDGGRVGAASPFLNQFVYHVIGNGPTLGTSTEAIIYKHDFVFVNDSAEPVPANPSSVLGAQGVYLLGGPNGESVDLGGGFIVPAVQTAVLVPEPSTLLLSAFGALALLRRKR